MAEWFEAYEDLTATHGSTGTYSGWGTWVNGVGVQAQFQAGLAQWQLKIADATPNYSELTKVRWVCHHELAAGQTAYMSVRILRPQPVSGEPDQDAFVELDYGEITNEYPQDFAVDVEVNRWWSISSQWTLQIQFIVPDLLGTGPNPLQIVRHGYIGEGAPWWPYTAYWQNLILHNQPSRTFTEPAPGEA